MQLNKKEQAAKEALGDIRWLLNTQGQGPDLGGEDTYLDGPRIIELLKANFSRLDPDADGITRDELMTALMNPEKFSDEEYEMLRLITKYFDTIINLSDDEDGPEETKISPVDFLVLEQFLVHSKMSLKELHDWCKLAESSECLGLDSMGPPPLSGN